MDPIESEISAALRALTGTHSESLLRGAWTMRMTKAIGLSLALSLFASMAICDVEVTYDESVNFEYLRKFSWAEGTPSEDESLQRRIEAAIQRELIVKGFRKDDEDPDFLIATHFEGDSVIIEMVDLESQEPFWRGVGTGAVPKKEKKLEYRINKATAKMFKKFPPKSK
jgi:hypothetical protein